MGRNQPESDSGSALAAPPFALGRGVAALVVLVVGGALVVAAALAVMGAMEHLAPALAGAAVALVAGIVALMPLHWADRRPASTAPLLAMAGSGLRVGVTLLGAMVLIGVVQMAMPAAALWTLGWYLLVMVFEIALIVRYFRSLPGPPADGRGGR